MVPGSRDPENRGRMQAVNWESIGIWTSRLVKGLAIHIKLGYYCGCKEVFKMGFKLFDKKRSHGGPPTVTITKNGMFVINSTAVEKRLKGFQYVHLYWDQEQDKIGIKPLRKKENTAYHINYSPKGNVGSISGTAFLAYAEISHKETASFPAQWNEEEELLEFKVDRTKTKGRGRD